LREIVGHSAALRVEGPVSVDVHLPSGAVEARVDSDQITQVLHNLLQNACDAAEAAHPSGGGTVSLELEGFGAEARIRVQDDGSGIPPERVESIFAPYSTDKEGGTGLGLAISRRIVTEHGGRIEVASRPGKTVFTVVLPTGLG
jgi:signal transduction histidine kinase